MGEIIEHEGSNFTGSWSIIAYHRYAPEYYQRPTYAGYRDCNCIIHDFAFQTRSSKSKRLIEGKKCGGKVNWKKLPKTLWASTTL